MAVTLFSYRYGDSAMHKAPAGIKLTLLVVLSVATFAGGTLDDVEKILSAPILIRTAICLSASLIAFALSGATAASLKRLSFVPILGGLLTIVKLLQIPSDFDYASEYSKFILSPAEGIYFNLNGLAGGILYTVRFFTASLAADIVFETTSPVQIQDALESGQDAAARVFPIIKKLNPALAISLVINFIPQIFDTWNRIDAAARARSNVKAKKGITRRARIFSLELQSLLSCMLAQAETKRKAILNRSAGGKNIFD